MVNTVYKIARIDVDGNYRSFSPPENYPLANLYYKIGEKTIPYFEKSLLFAFDTEENARRYLDSLLSEDEEDYNNNFILLECETNNELEQIKDLCFSYPREYWIGDFINKYHLHAVPTHTIGVKSLVPKRIIPW